MDGISIGLAAIYDIAFAAAAGILWSRLWLGGSDSRELVQSLRRLLIAVAAAMLMVVPLQILQETAVMIGSTRWSDLRAALPDVLTTHVGHTLLLNAYLLPLLIIAAVLPLSLRSRRLAIVQLGVLAVIAAIRSALGHAAEDGSFTVREVVQFLHLTSIAVWSGGIVVAGLVVTPRLLQRDSDDDLILYLQRLSRTVTLALVVVMLSGAYNSWKGLGGSLAPLPHTQWGRMLLLKVAVVVLVLAHGARVRLLAHHAVPDTTAIRRWLRMEALLMLLVLVVSAWLATLPPANMS